MARDVESGQRKAIWASFIFDPESEQRYSIRKDAVLDTGLISSDIELYRFTTFHCGAVHKSQHDQRAPFSFSKCQNNWGFP